MAKGFKVDKDKKIIYIFNVDKIKEEEWMTIDTYQKRLGYTLEETTKTALEKKKNKVKTPDVGYRKVELLFYFEKYGKDNADLKKEQAEFIKLCNDKNFMKAKSIFKINHKTYEAEKIANEYEEEAMPKAKEEMRKYMKENATQNRYDKFSKLLDEDFFKALAEYTSFKQAKEKKNSK